MNTLKTCLAVCALLIGGTSAQAQSTTVTAAFSGGELGWQGNGRTQVRWTPTIVNGELYICGAYSSLGGRDIRQLSRVLMREGKIKRGNTVVVNTLSFFSQVSNASFQQKLVGQTANCRGTGIPATDNSAFAGLELEIKPGRYRTP